MIHFPSTRPAHSRSRLGKPTPWLGLIGVLCALALGACGGGGGGGGQSSSSSDSSGSTPSPSPSPAPTPAALVCGNPSFVGSALESLNAIRAAGATCGSTAYPPAGALKWNSALNAASQAHSADMAAQNYFSHTSLNGRSPWQRMSAAGYTGTGVGENIAAGQANVAAVLSAWMTSAGHCANIMNATANELGLACAPGVTGSQYTAYWTMGLGRSN